MNISFSPHIHSGDSVQKNMYRVIIALLPAWIVSIVCFGVGAAVVSTTAIVSCVLFEYLISKFLLKREPTLLDGSAFLTGLLLALNLPSNLPFWMVIIGSLIAIGVGKMAFGGIGSNLFNPALVGRVFLLISFPSAMTTWPKVDVFSTHYMDAVTEATPLWLINNGYPLPENALTNFFLGNMSGSMGEISAIALLIGGIYLLLTKTITWHIPVSILATVALFTGIMHAVDPTAYSTPIFHLLSGGLLLGAIFMATDYVTSPMTAMGKIIFGVGIGIITVVIRLFGIYPEGMSFAILIMNAVTPLINKYCLPKRF